MPDNTTNSYQYYPVVIEDDYPLTRDELYDKFRERDILVRKYFYPACSDYECYKNDRSIIRTELKITNLIKNKVLCLPYYSSLDVQTLINIKNIMSI